MMQQTQSWQPSMPRDLPKYVQLIRSKGRDYAYVRIGGQRVRLHADPGTPAFHREYAGILARFRDDPAPVRHGEGTVAWLIEQYKRSPGYRALRPKTQASYAKELDRLQPIGMFAAVDVRRRHINAIRDTLEATPRVRQLFGQVCSLLFNYGISELDLDCMNPARRMRQDHEGKSYVAWSTDERAAFEASNLRPHVRTGYMIAAYAAPRRGDIVALCRNDYDGQRLRIKGSKTGNPVLVPAHGALRAHLDSLPETATLVADERGSPVAADRLSKDIRVALDAIGLRHLSLHGLRHSAAAALAEAGCTPHEIMAVTGHKTTQMVEHYTGSARQERLARSAIRKLEGRE